MGPFHGHRPKGKASPTYYSWKSMISRCFWTGNPSYVRYGGRGIKVCSQWKDFRNFLFDMGERPRGTWIDRKNSDGDYKKSNCRWATPKEQENNKRNNRRLRFHGIELTVSQWADRTGINSNTILSRLRYGWKTRLVLTKPVQVHHFER